MAIGNISAFASAISRNRGVASDRKGSKEGCVHRSKLEGGSNWSGAVCLTSTDVGPKSSGAQGLNK